MKKGKKIIALTLLCTSIISSTAFAATVNLTPGESSDVSSAIGLKTSVSVSGSNYSSSKREVYFDVLHSEPGKSFKTRVDYLIAVGQPLKKTTVTHAISSSWKLELNPKGIGTSGCSAYGEIL